MKIERFEDIIAWQKAELLAIEVYNYFNNSKDFGFREQIQRAAVSIMNNIAEGFERGTNKEFIHFLFIAKGSCAEVRSMLHLARKLEKVDELKHSELLIQAEEISKIISGLIKSLQ
jgi:four helix bundle protein